ncbi:hypothetical protein [Fusobacterium sp. CAG:649]|uniref:hypothetical protein n=1 Tax=Fusobacterium sp. CAG:649 TaxID=1262900 RepID=UPI00258CDA89|nr:hypothetical protein [Fusobacterium sp. CAG:649]
MLAKFLNDKKLTFAANSASRKVIESGKHIKLCAKKGLYYEMYKHQEELETYLTKRGENNEKSVNF